MKKDWILLIASVSVTLVVALVIIRWFAPGLLGIPVDLQLVQSAREVPPFFEGVFRQEDINSKELLLQDPNTKVRARPFVKHIGVYGPSDILGFRNHYVPNVADFVVIGDSQTYGNTAILEQNWPEHLRRLLSSRKTEIYSMAAGGWGAVQYLDMFTKAITFQPRQVIVAFYSGNDPIESYAMVYGNPKWNFLIPDKRLSKSDIPHVTYPAPESEWWTARFSDNVKTIFTPTLRLGSNSDHPAIQAGYQIMADVAHRIGQMAKSSNIMIIFTVIPTKELVYAEKVKKENFNPPEDYNLLVKNEMANINLLRAEIKKQNTGQYIDLVAPMQKAALNPVELYSEDINGHPNAAGYEVIAKSLLTEIKDIPPNIPNGLVSMMISKNRYEYLLITNEGVWVFTSVKMIEENGWPPGEIPIVTYRDISKLPTLGLIDKVDPGRFGPQNIR